VPPSIRLEHRRVALYLARVRHRRYQLLGSGTLSGGAGHYSASFQFLLVNRVGPSDFVTACFGGLYRQGMEFGDGLDRRCGAARIHF